MNNANEQEKFLAAQQALLAQYHHLNPAHHLPTGHPTAVTPAPQQSPHVPQHPLFHYPHGQFPQFGNGPQFDPRIILNSQLSNGEKEKYLASLGLYQNGLASGAPNNSSAFRESNSPNSKQLSASSSSNNSNNTSVNHGQSSNNALSSIQNNSSFDERRDGSISPTERSIENDDDDQSLNGTNNGEWTYEEQFKQLYELSDDAKRKEFLDDLFAFMQKRGSPVNRIPIMAKHVLDLYELYKLVVSKGGLVEVINKKLWREITKGLNLPSSITSAAFTLRTQYMKYLYPYECEKLKLSSIQELQSAIDGNRREGRRPAYGFEYSSPNGAVQNQQPNIGMPPMHANTPNELIHHAHHHPNPHHAFLAAAAAAAAAANSSQPHHPLFDHHASMHPNSHLSHLQLQSMGNNPQSYLKSYFEMNTPPNSSSSASSATSQRELMNAEGLNVQDMARHSDSLSANGRNILGSLSNKRSLESFERLNADSASNKQVSKSSDYSNEVREPLAKKLYMEQLSNKNGDNGEDSNLSSSNSTLSVTGTSQKSHNNQNSVCKFSKVKITANTEKGILSNDGNSEKTMTISMEINGTLYEGVLHAAKGLSVGGRDDEN